MKNIEEFKSEMNKLEVEEKNLEEEKRKLLREEEAFNNEIIQMKNTIQRMKNICGSDNTYVQNLISMKENTLQEYENKSRQAFDELNDQIRKETREINIKREKLEYENHKYN